MLGRIRSLLLAKELGVLVLLLAAPFTVLSQPGSAEKPNFVFILADDMGLHQLGCYGGTYYQTPHIDRLATQGMRFTRAYSAAPICSPTRASLMTGKYPARVRVTDSFPAATTGGTRSCWCLTGTRCFRAQKPPLPKH
jgi:arylsulfatase A-like enzyme